MILDSHRFVLIGGPHGGGSSLLWKLLEAQPGVSAFPMPSTLTTGLSEGAFLQSVIPTFGINPDGRDDRRWLQQASDTSGLGRYAFSPASHLTEASPLNTNASSRALLSQWSRHWNMSLPVLLEKTPAHMVTSRLLNALLAPRATFLFITRHPLAVAITHRRWACCKRMNLGTLLLHWVASHRVLANDLPHLPAHSARVLRYEDLAARTRGCLVDEMLSFLRLSSDVDVPRRVAVRANVHQETIMCERLLDTPQKVQRYCALAGAVQPAVDALGLGYDLQRGSPLGFSCLPRALANVTGNRLQIDPCAGVPPVPWVVKALNQQWMGGVGGAGAGAGARAAGGAIPLPAAGPSSPLKERLLCGSENAHAWPRKGGSKSGGKGKKTRKKSGRATNNGSRSKRRSGGDADVDGARSAGRRKATKGLKSSTRPSGHKTRSFENDAAQGGRVQKRNGGALAKEKEQQPQEDEQESPAERTVRRASKSKRRRRSKGATAGQEKGDAGDKTKSGSAGKRRTRKHAIRNKPKRVAAAEEPEESWMRQKKQSHDEKHEGEDDDEVDPADRDND